MSIWIQITAGDGPAECCYAVARIADLFCSKAKEKNADLYIHEQIKGEHAGTYQSITYYLQNVETAPDWMLPWVGTILWICKSPYRSTHKRKNWFIAIQLIQAAEAGIWKIEDVRIETFRASGPGGQHVNKTESAVRATHLPTALVALAQDGRSQHENRRLAIERLKQRFETEEKRIKAQGRSQLRNEHANLERGNAIMTFSGLDFKPVI